MRSTTYSSIQVGLLMLLSVGALSLANAPIGLWPLAWFALAPWLVAIGRTATMRAALAQGWLSGVVYFAVNLWWLWTASIPGTVVLVMYFAMYWSLAAGLIYYFQLVNGVDALDASPGDSTTTTQGSNHRALNLSGRVLAIAVIWVAAEWLRCNVASGFPWLPLGCTQSPVVAMCQVADFGGPWIVSFWLVLPSAWLATVWFERESPRSLVMPGTLVVAILACVAIYGVWRLQTTTAIEGPQVIVIQSNVPHLPGGAPSVDRQESVADLLEQIEASLSEQPADLVVLPEAALPPINDEARRELAQSPISPFLEQTHDRLLTLARGHNAALLVGGSAVTGWTTSGREHVGSEIRNSVYFIDPQPNIAVGRYDKIYLARFSERAPLTIGPNWLRALAMRISASRASQPLHAGTLRELQPFSLRWKNRDGTRDALFITPICLENIDPAVIARMMRGPGPGRKRANFIANVSNDGWFAAQEKYQHWQTTVFRCIENRVPMVRSSNTGISGFIDSCGRVRNTVLPNSKGFSVQRIQFDDRLTIYTRYGDVFPLACVALVAAVVACRLAACLLAFARRTRATA
jgi:apolipoprotein N-acyltransferase